MFRLLTNSGQHIEGGNSNYKPAVKPSYDPYAPPADDDLSAEQYDAVRHNYKCEESEETIFITKTEVITERICSTQYRVECSQVYIGGKLRWKMMKECVSKLMKKSAMGMGTTTHPYKVNVCNATSSAGR